MLIDRNKAWWRVLLRFQRAIMFISVVSVILLISSGAVMRYVFKMDFYGIEDVTLVVAFWLYFIGGAYGSYSKNHVSAEVIPNYMKNKKSRNIVLIIKTVMTATLNWIFTYWAFMLLMWGFERFGRTATLGIPLVIPQSALFIGMLLMSFYTTIYAIEDIMQFMKNNQTDLIMKKEVL